MPQNKVKLVVGAGGSKIYEIQKKSKTRLQIQKDQEELSRAFGSGGAAADAIAAAAAAAAAQGEPPSRKMVKIFLYGDSKGVEIAERMVHEAIDNRDQKVTQSHHCLQQHPHHMYALFHINRAAETEAPTMPAVNMKLLQW